MLTSLSISISSLEEDKGFWNLNLTKANSQNISIVFTSLIILFVEEIEVKNSSTVEKEISVLLNATGQGCCCWDSVRHWWHPLCKVVSILCLSITVAKGHDVSVHHINCYFNSFDVADQIMLIGVKVDHHNTVTGGVINVFCDTCFHGSNVFGTLSLEKLIEHAFNELLSFIKIWCVCSLSRYRSYEQCNDWSEFHSYFLWYLYKIIIIYK